MCQVVARDRRVQNDFALCKYYVYDDASETGRLYPTKSRPSHWSLRLWWWVHPEYERYEYPHLQRSRPPFLVGSCTGKKNAFGVEQDRVGTQRLVVVTCKWPTT